MEAKFRQWLQRCHATLDKSVRFEALADGRTQVSLPCCCISRMLSLYFHRACLPACGPEAVRQPYCLKTNCCSIGTQAALRAKLGEDTTAFERITDGIRTVCRGDVVRINAKPQLVGRVQHFTIPQVGTGGDKQQQAAMA